MDISVVTKSMRKALPLKYCGAVIVAAGTASRMEGIDKVMAELDGEPMILRTVRTFQDCDAIKEIVVVTREDLILPVMRLCAGFTKLQAVICGGATRPESVQLGLNALSNKVKLVAVQDGARPLVTEAVIDRAVRAAHTYGAAAPAVPVKDTIKVVQGGVVKETPNRATLQAVQTPQVFYRHLYEALALSAKRDEFTATDDASIAEHYGHRVKLVETSRENIKITTPFDISLAEVILSRREKNKEDVK